MTRDILGSLTPSTTRNVRAVFHVKPSRQVAHVKPTYSLLISLHISDVSSSPKRSLRLVKRAEIQAGLQSDPQGARMLY